MKKFISIFLVFCGLFLFISCEKEVEPDGARLIDENTIPEYPVNKLRFKWRGDIGVEQKLVMWIDWFHFDIVGNPPVLFQIGIPKNFTPSDGNLFVYETDLWEPLPYTSYHWKVVTYYSDGKVVSSETRTFVPFPVQ